TVNSRIAFMYVVRKRAKTYAKLLLRRELKGKEKNSEKNSTFYYSNRSGWQERIERLSMDSQDKNTSDVGQPVQIVLAHPDHSFELNEEALSKILLENDIKNRSVVV
ncbi:unnamed protein product, partial [Heterotrigona itama]